MYLLFQGHETIAGVIDLGTVETFAVFQSAQRGLIDQDTCYVLLEAQLVRGGLLHPDSPQGLSLEQSFSSGLINSRIHQSLSEIEAALHLVRQSQLTKSHTIPVAAAMELGCIKEPVGLRILELQVSTGGFWDDSNHEILSLENAKEKGLISAGVYDRLCARLNRQELIDPNTAEKLSLSEFYQRCILNQETGLHLLPVNQQSRGTICLRSGINVGIFRAVQEGLIDQEVTIRLLEAQLFAGGITDPRTGHRLTVDEAVRHGLMDQDLSCALLTHQLQSGGIIDPVSGERLELDESIQRNLLTPRMALRVLESLWAFMGMLWPESGELLLITDALQQGVISGDLARKVLSKRHSIAAIYSPESGELIPLAHAEKVLEPEAAKVLQQTHIPDILPVMTPKRSLQRWGSSFSSALSSPAPASLPRLQSDTSLVEVSRPQEQDLHYLLSYLMTHSYINAHSGERLVLLEPELMELINVTGTTKDQNRHKPHLKEPSDREATGEPELLRLLSGTKQENIEIPIDGKKSLRKEDDTDITDNIRKTALKNVVQSVAGNAIEETSTDRTLLNLSDTGSRVPETEPEATPLFVQEVETLSTDSTFQSQSSDIEVMSGPELFRGLTEAGSWHEVQMPTSNENTLDENQVECAPSVNKVLDIKRENTAVETICSDTIGISQCDELHGNDREGLQGRKNELSYVNKQIPAQNNRNVENADTSEIIGTMSVDISEDTELDRMATELLQGGLLNTGTQKSLLDEAVYQDLLPCNTALKVMSKAELFGGFLDVHACHPLSLDDIIQEGLLDKDFMTKVIQSEKIMAGVCDVEHGRICSLSEAAKEGLLDTETASRLLEGQIVSGGIIDLEKGKKVSVNHAAKLGLIEGEQKHELLLLEKAYHGKTSDPHVIQTKLKLQLQMTGIIDSKTKQPVPLQQALQKGLIGHEETEQILLQQIAEGGIVHHGSGVRLSVTDAINQGLIDSSLAPKLQQFENSRQNQFSSDPNAAFVQAAVGFIYDGASKSNITLAEAVSRGVINQDTANKAMDSQFVKGGVLDPQNACVVPYSELIKQGKIDIKTGWRFLEVRPFRGIPSKENGGLMTVPEAVKAGQVDSITALRLLQSQADSGGIINIKNGEKLSLLEAVDEGLVQKDVAMDIAKKQFLKGGLVSPVSGQKVSSLMEAVQNRLISKEMATQLFDNFGLVDPIVSQSVSYQESPTVSSWENIEVSTVHFADIQKPQSRTSDLHKDKLEADTDEHLRVLQHYTPSELVEQIHVDVSSSGVGKDADVSLEILSRFALKAEKRLQDAIEECSPKEQNGVEPQQESRHGLVQIPQISAVEYEVGKDYHIVPQTTKPDIQTQLAAGIGGTEIGINLENYEKSSLSVVSENTHMVHDGQVSSVREAGEITKAPELQSVSDASTILEREESTDNRKDAPIANLTEETKMAGKKKGKGKDEKQTKICTESAKRSDVQLLDATVTLQEIEDKNGAEVYTDGKSGRPSLTAENVSVFTPTEDANGSRMIENQKPEHLASSAYGKENTTVKADTGIGRETVVTDQKSEGEAQVDLEVLKSPRVSITSPIGRIDTMFEKDAVINQKSEDMHIKKGTKIDLEVIKASDLTEEDQEDSLVKDTENKFREDVAVLDQKCAEDLKEFKEVTVDLEVVMPPYVSVTSSTESTEHKFGQELVTDQHSEDVMMKRKVDLEVMKAADMTEVSLEEYIEDKSGTEIISIRQKSGDSSEEDGGGQKYVEKQREIKMDSEALKSPCMNVTSTTEGAKEFENNRGNLLLTSQNESTLGNLDVTKTPYKMVDSPAGQMENRFTKELFDIDQKSIDEDVRQVKAEILGVPETESIPESLNQRVELVKRQHMENISLGPETSIYGASSLLDDHINRKDELQHQMQSTVINDVSNAQVDNEIDYPEDHASGQSDKKKKKKRKSKKAKTVTTEKESEESKVEEPAQRPPIDVPSQSETFGAVRKDGIEQPQKPNQTQLEKKALLMKAKESILRKVFERGVSEKQAAEELEALRQGSGKERHVTAEEKVKLEEKSSSLCTKGNETDVINQTKQRDKNETLLPGDVLTRTDSTQTHFSQTTQPNDNFYKKQGLSCTNSSDVAMDPSKQISKPTVVLDRQVGETATKETEHQKNEKLGHTAVPKEPYTTLTGEDKDHQKSVTTVTLATDAVPQSEINTYVQTSKAEMESTISKEPLQAMTKEYSYTDNEFRDESSIEESSESRLSNLEEVPESDTTECWEDEDFEECQEGLHEKQTEVKKQKITPQISKVGRMMCLC